MTTNIKEKQMEILLHEFQLLSKTILTQLMLVKKLLQDNHLDALYEEVEGNEIIIDRLELKIREEVVFSIFKFNPVAADLRLIIAYQDLTTNLERIGDMLLNVVNSLKDVHYVEDNLNELHHLLQKMMDDVSDMTRDAIHAFSAQDKEVAYEVIEKDDIVDEQFHRLKIYLQDKYDGKQVTKEDIKEIEAVNEISHNLERIGDSATNIAEAIVFIVEGKDIRHGKES